MADSDDIFCVSRDYEITLKDFIRNCNNNDIKHRNYRLVCLYDEEDKDLKEPIRKYITEGEWATLIVLVNNYLRSFTKQDWEKYYTYFNKFSESQWPD